MKKIAIILSFILIICSAIAILLESPFSKNIGLQRLFARFSLLSDERILDAAGALHDKDNQKFLNQAVLLYREALSRDPENPYRWSELGLALLDSDKFAEAEYCFRRALEHGPNDTIILWRAFEYYTQIKQPREALRCAAKILQKKPSATDSIFSYYIKPGFLFPDTLKYGIPPNKRIVAQAYLRYLIQKGNAANADQCWNWVFKNSFADNKLAGEYFSFLLRSGEPAKARNAWSAWIGNPKGANLLFDTGFESEPLPSPFDWKISQIKGAEVTRDPAFSHEGKWSLRIVFDGKENPAYRHISQVVFLDPGTYRFRGFIRSQGITTEQGIGLRIGSIATQQITGTSDWKELAQTIKVSEPSLLRLEIFRNVSWKIANRLSGTVWLDDIQLIRVSIP